MKKLSALQIARYTAYYFIYGLVKYLPTPIGEPLRFLVLKCFMGRLGSSSFRIRDGATIHAPENVSIGEHSTLNEWVNIDGTGGVTIGNYVRIGHRASILSADHSFSDRKTPIARQGFVAKAVTIDDDVWIGCNVIILKGVRIGKGSIISAGAVVTRNVPPYAIVAGVPARIIAKR